MTSYFDDEKNLREAVRIAPVLNGIEETEVDGFGPSWSFGRICLAKDYPAYEIHDHLTDLMPESAFRKIPFEFPAENLRGILVTLPYKRTGDATYEVMAGQVPIEQEYQLDEWLTFLNAEIRAAHAAKAARDRGRS